MSGRCTVVDMKTTGFITSIVLVGLQAFVAAENTTPTTTPADGTTPMACCGHKAADCPPPGMTPQGTVQGFGQEWLNIDTVTLEAANGDPIAQYTLAYLTDTGTQTPQDKDKAAQMYADSRPSLEQAAKAGSAAACHALAHMCATGKGCEKDPEQAKKYAKMAKDCCTTDTEPTTTPAN